MSLSAYEWDRDDETQRHSGSAIAKNIERTNDVERKINGELVELREEKDVLLQSFRNNIGRLVTLWEDEKILLQRLTKIQLGANSSPSASGT